MSSRDLRELQGKMSTGAKWLGIGVVAIGIYLWIQTQLRKG
jgi:hypothetical protein